MSKAKTVIRTMQEFSEYVGVSRPTVSKFFSDPASVRANTRKKLESAAKELSFQPNMLAVNFKRKKTNLIGVIIPDATDPFYASLTQQVTHIADQSGMITIVLGSDGDNELQSRSISTVMGMQVAGVIFVPTTHTEKNQQEITRLINTTPTVFVDTYTDLATHFVGTDNTQSITLIVEYLLRSGSPPCYFPMPLVNSNAVLRYETYAAVMQKAGYEPRLVPTDDSLNWNFEAWACQQAQKVLENGGFPTSTILCANDRIAYGVMAACHAAGLKIGRNEDDDLRIAGHDDHPLARYTYPPLTTVRQNTADIASIATEMLLEMVQAQNPLTPEKTLLDSTLQLRDSA
ncbi:MAG: LacI family DNA-binding transcriptional regulator [Thiolinea sp.]